MRATRGSRRCCNGSSRSTNGYAPGSATATSHNSDGCSTVSTPMRRKDEKMQTIDEFLDVWTTAEREGDADTLDRILTDDFVGVGPLGFVLPKPAWLGRYRAGGMHYDRFDLDEVQTRVLDRTAVVVARQNQDGSAQGHPVPEAARATLVLNADGDAWRLAALHLSFIAGTRGAPPMPGADGR